MNYARKSSEQANVKFRRSLYFVRDLSPGDVVSTQDVRSVRPGYGLAPKHIEAVIGKKVTRHVHAATPVEWDAFA